MSEVQTEQLSAQQPSKSNSTNENKKVQAENMRLKKHIYELEREIDSLRRFIGGM